MSAITILNQGQQPDAGASAALDVSAFSILRLDTFAHADMGRHLTITLFIETSPTENGRWTTLWSRRMTSRGNPESVWRIIDRVTLGGFDNYIRLRFEGKADDGAPANWTLGLSGTALPTAA